MTTTPRRAVAATIAALALAAPVAMGTSATATPDDKHGSSKAPKAPKTKQLVKAIDVKDAQLERLATADRTTVLSDDVESAFVANIDADRAALASLRTDAEAIGSTLDAKAVRKDLHDFRVVNYVLAGNILRQVENVEEALAADPEAVAHLTEAVDAALAITAASAKADVREAREHLKLAKAEVDETDEAPAPVV